MISYQENKRQVRIVFEQLVYFGYLRLMNVDAIAKAFGLDFYLFLFQKGQQNGKKKLAVIPIQRQ